MNKIPENKTRKRLRTAMWVFYLLEIVLCSLPYYQYSMDGKIYSNSVFDMLSALGAGNDIGCAGQKEQHEKHRFNSLLSARRSIDPDNRYYQSDFARLDARAAPLYLDQLSHGFLDLRAFLGSFRCGESC